MSAGEYVAPTAEDRARDRQEVDAITESMRAEASAIEAARPTGNPVDAFKVLADRAIAEWATFACRGELEYHARCTVDNQSKCEREDWLACPKRVLDESSMAIRGKAARHGFSSEALCDLADICFDCHPLRMRPCVHGRARALKWSDAIDRTVKSFADGRYFVVLSGDTGTGKTLAATLLSVIRGARCITAPAMLALSRFDGSFSEICNVPALVVDDLGTEYMDGKGEAASRWDELVNVRYTMARSRRFPTVLTCNLTVEEFRNRYGVRVTDRLHQVGRFWNIGGKSMRRAS